MTNRRVPSHVVLTLFAYGAIVLGSIACGRSEAPVPGESRAAPLATPGGEPEPLAPTPAPEAPSTASSPAATPAPTPAPAPAPAPAGKPVPESRPTAPPAAGGNEVADPGGEIAVAATKSGLARIGSDKCKICHKVQYASWAESGHAKRTPALDCESCHGPGSEYKTMAVMKDPVKAKAAGMVMPEATFCKTCHKQGWNDGLLKEAHAHKAG